jgi:hypothetical protein
MSASPALSKDPSPSPEKDVEQVDEKERSGSSPSEAETNTGTGTSVEPTPVTTSAPSSWQAIWSPAHSAYYFYNSTTQETTWVNPLQPPSATSGDSNATTTTAATSPSAPTPTPASGSGSVPSTSTSTGGSDNPNAPQEGDPSSSSSASGATPVPASIAQIYALQEAAAAQGIDPSLAYLDPSLAGGSSSVPGSSGSVSGTYNFTAKFNAHTGTFARPDGRDPTHLSEYERMKRMSSVYFNMEQWEQEVAQRKGQEDEDAANGKKRKRPTKKDLVRCLFCAFFDPILQMLIVILIAGALQRAKEVEEDRQDSLAAHVDSGGASRVFFFLLLWAVHIGGIQSYQFCCNLSFKPFLPQKRPDADIHVLPSSNGSQQTH